MKNDYSLYALSAVDGRYYEKIEQLSEYFSESASIRYRVEIEMGWLKTMVHHLHKTA